MARAALTTDVRERLPGPPRLDLTRVALFCDLDGTLAPIEARPDDVGPDPRRTRLLERLSAALDGRLAVVSGRSLEDLDRVLGGRVTAMAAIHGLLRRTADGRVLTADGPPLPADARQALTAFARAEPALLLEDKGPAIALHYRAKPEAREACREIAQRVAGRDGLTIQEGDMVVEVRQLGPTKGEAVEAFLREAPFAGFQPVFLGDDLTDEDGFAAALRLGGYGVVVGPRRPTVATYALAGVEAAFAWLGAALEPEA